MLARSELGLDLGEHLRLQNDCNRSSEECGLYCLPWMMQVSKVVPPRWSITSICDLTQVYVDVQVIEVDEVHVPSPDSAWSHDWILVDCFPPAATIMTFW